VVIITRRYYALAHNTPQIYILVKIFVHFQNILKRRKIPEALFSKEPLDIINKVPLEKYRSFGPRSSSQEEQFKSNSLKKILEAIIQKEPFDIVNKVLLEEYYFLRLLNIIYHRLKN